MKTDILELLDKIEGALGHYSDIGCPDPPYIKTNDSRIKECVQQIRQILQNEELLICTGCGRLFLCDDDFDTLGSESGVICPNCGCEKFQTAKYILNENKKLVQIIVEDLGKEGYEKTMDRLNKKINLEEIIKQLEAELKKHRWNPVSEGIKVEEDAWISFIHPNRPAGGSIGGICLATPRNIRDIKRNYKFFRVVITPGEEQQNS